MAGKKSFLVEDPFKDLAGDEGQEGTCEVTCLPEGRVIDAPKGLTVLDAARREGVPLPRACGGRARCGTCRLLVEEGHRNLSPKGFLEKRTLRLYELNDPSHRLGCQARIQGPVRVRILMTQEEAADSWKEGKAYKPRGGWK